MHESWRCSERPVAAVGGSAAIGCDNPEMVRGAGSQSRDVRTDALVRVPGRINNLPIHARVMTALLFQDRERTRFTQGAVASARDGRCQNWTSILQEISHLFLQVDLH
jgi:hypothetical protein